MRNEDKERLVVLEMWIWRKMEEVKWSDEKTNEQALMDVEEERSFLKAVVKRKINWIVHVVRGEGLMKLVTEGRMVGKKSNWKSENGND
jgi:hypothetical protein